jgi:hypothetical protein
MFNYCKHSPTVTWLRDQVRASAVLIQNDTSFVTLVRCIYHRCGRNPDQMFISAYNDANWKRLSNTTSRSGGEDSQNTLKFAYTVVNAFMVYANT